MMLSAGTPEKGNNQQEDEEGKASSDLRSRNLDLPDAGAVVDLRERKLWSRLIPRQASEHRTFRDF
jgi:hypothetical protein